jgi:hypothetical protein
MEGDRLTAVQQTLRVLIAKLSDTDKLTLILYNTDAVTLCRAESDKARLLTYTDSLVAEGGTHLESAILALADLEELPQAFFLLTDGHINKGARSPAALEQLLKMILKGKHIPVNTLGYGVDHAAAILQRVALATRGTYTFAEAAELIPSVVGDMLAAVETVALQDVHVDAGEGAQCLELQHTNEDQATSTYWLGNLISNKSHWVLFDVPATAGPTLTLRFTQNEGEMITATTDIQDVNSYQTDVAEQWFRCRTVKALHHAGKRGLHVGRLVALEHEMANSPVAQTTLVLSLRASITDMLKQLESNNNPAATLRMLSNVTTMGMQRGILVPDPLVTNTIGGQDTLSMFQSPRQRYVSNSLVSGFSQTQTEQ